MNKYKINKWIAYKLKAKNEFSLHSPYLFNLYNSVFKKKHLKEEYLKAEEWRKTCLKNNLLITVEDFGAGSKVFKSNTRKIADIAKVSLKNKKYALFIAELCRFHKANTIIELGTCLGVTTSYIAIANPEAKIYTIEGSSSILDCAFSIFKENKFDNISACLGNFDERLPQILLEQNGFDVLFIDGNHTYEATLRYFQMAKAKAREKSIIIFDDIYWDKAMSKAWEEIKKDESITVSIDMFEMGIVFFNKDLSKQDFILKY